MVKRKKGWKEEINKEEEKGKKKESPMNLFLDSHSRERSLKIGIDENLGSILVSRFFVAITFRVHPWSFLTSSETAIPLRFTHASTIPHYP
jgi:hypothetical protein